MQNRFLILKRQANILLICLTREKEIFIRALWDSKISICVSSHFGRTIRYRRITRIICLLTELTQSSDWLIAPKARVSLISWAKRPITIGSLSSRVHSKGTNWTAWEIHLPPTWTSTCIRATSKALSLTVATSMIYRALPLNTKEIIRPIYPLARPLV